MSSIREMQKDILEVEHQIQKLLVDFQHKHQLPVYNLGFKTISFLGQHMPMPLVEMEIRL